VYIPLPGIGSIPAENITSRFLDRSFEVKIRNYNGKNWIFAVPKTQCQILVKKSKVAQKADKLIVSLGKMADSDNWFSLHKVKCIGEKDTD
jgi:calcyclin binding protein